MRLGVEKFLGFLLRYLVRDMKRICVIGACCTRDAFNKKFIPEWREHFTLETYYFQPSIISMMSERIPFKMKNIDDSKNNGFWQDIFVKELRKEYVDQIISLKPEVIVLDFYSDVINGVLRIDNHSYITDKTRRWESIPFFSQLKKDCLKSYDNFSAYFSLWKNSYYEFAKVIRDGLPGTLVIVNSCRCMHQYEKDGRVLEYKTSKLPDIKKLNHIWEQFDRYAENCGAKIISYQNEYLLDPNYIFGGLWVVHYENKFYRDFFEKLNKIL